MTESRFYTSPTRRPPLSHKEYSWKSILGDLVIGLLLRGLLTIYGLWQDSVMAVKYTDVDYFVFTDAARFVTEGLSPYERATYRYTPLLAWMLTPNVYFGKLFGKGVFVLADVATALMIFLILRLRRCSCQMATNCMRLWLFNPLSMAVSTRGNAESLIALLVLGTLYCFVKASRLSIMMGSLLYALSVHMKIYPVTYSLPLYLYLNNMDADLYRISSNHTCFSKISAFIRSMWPKEKTIIYISVTTVVIVILTGVCYICYGDVFLQETYLYHISRRDTRHNFSVYFYVLYLTAESSFTQWIGLAVFIPQALLLLLISIRYHHDLPFCCFLQTFVFVTFNKVCTSQYFLWYMSLLPLVVPQIQQTMKQACFLIMAWFLGQAIWLLPAYYLEFEGQPTFLLIWIASIVFFAINVSIMCFMVSNYVCTPVYIKGHIASMPHLDSYTTFDNFRKWIKRKKTV